MIKNLPYLFFTIFLLFSMQLSAAEQADIKAIQESAEQGDAIAQSKLAASYYMGQDGITPDRKLAAVWFKKAAEQGDLDSMVMLAAMHDGGLGVSQSTGDGTRWYKKAADLGHEPSKGVLSYYTLDERPLKAMQIAFQYAKAILKKK